MSEYSRKRMFRNNSPLVNLFLHGTFWLYIMTFTSLQKQAKILNSSHHLMNKCISDETNKQMNNSRTLLVSKNISNNVHSRAQEG